MAEKCKIGIGAPTYNSVKRLEMLLSSIELYGLDGYDARIVILDDGSPDPEMRRGVEELALRFGTDFIQHEKNEGIPVAWNSLTDHFNSEISVLFNDDICVCNENWLKCIVYALEQNEKVACVGGPLIQIDAVTGLPNKNYSLPDFSQKPGVAGAVVGCSFAFKRKAYTTVNGFEKSIRSFYEESVAGDRYTVIKDKNNNISVIAFEELFNKFDKSKINISSNKSVVLDPGIYVLSSIKNNSYEFKIKYSLSTNERVIYNKYIKSIEELIKLNPIEFCKKNKVQKNHENTVSRIKIKLLKETQFCEGIWKPIKKIIRKKTENGLIKISQKYGQVEVTPHHSLMTFKNFLPRVPRHIF